ncbi:MAG TPA: TIGR03557 family F420-dependent LLM class oxidoreductase [Actinomycetota bacterium]|nr:TIGR03557 family F420-dependent LLM class oxidoreductase [Actinomycetota bacterium]
MVAIGFTLSSEEHGPQDLLLYGRIAEEVGFDFLTISDHFHPWTSRQGQSPFVWNVLGGLAVKTERVPIMTGVTCPTMRLHPAIVAQAAATTAALLPDRFVLGVGSGENLNEHVLGQGWPHPRERLEMLEEAIFLMRRLWAGELVTEWTDHYMVDRARLYTLPESPPPIAVAASSPTSAELAGRLGDALISTAPKRELVDAFRSTGGDGKPVLGQLTVCYGPDERKAADEALEWWPNTSVPGELGVELLEPQQFEDAAELVTAEQVAEKVVCGPDVTAFVEKIGGFAEAGFDHVFVHQVGPRQEEFLGWAKEELLPAIDDQLGRSDVEMPSGSSTPSDRG